MREHNPLNLEERLIRLLGLKGVEELNRVLSKPADEKPEVPDQLRNGFEIVRFAIRCPF
jgi:hypothetical protein